MNIELTAIQNREYASKLNGYFFGKLDDPGPPPTSSDCGLADPTDLHIPDSVPTRLKPLKEKLTEIVINNQPLIENIVVQGSYGDFTEINYSDLDLVVFINENALHSPSGRCELRKIGKMQLTPLMLRTDPLQHHGFFTVWPGLLDCYIDDILPIIVYQKSWGVFSRDYRFRISSYPTSPERTLNLVDTIIREISAVNDNMFHVKRLLSHIMILPSVWHSTTGQSVFKPNSFPRFLERFPEMGDTLTLASSIRERWPDCPVFLRTINQLGLGFKLFGNRWPRICGLMYPGKEIKSLVKSINVDACISVRNRLQDDLF